MAMNFNLARFPRLFGVDRKQRRLHLAVPRYLWVCLALVAGLQATLAMRRDAPQVSASALGHPPSAHLMRIASLDDPLPAVKVLNLLLQTYDVQPGLSLSFRHLDYQQLVLWLGRIVELDPQGQYPLLAAARLYSNVFEDPRRQQLMTDFVARQFLGDPAGRWQWMVHAVYVAKSQIHDIPLALSYAASLRQLAEKFPQIPYWAAQLEIFIRANEGDAEGAKALLGALLDSGKITDENEQRFLLQTLESL
jgi:hypothetical protein